jgi:hypothetical protein
VVVERTKVHYHERHPAVEPVASDHANRRVL